MATAPLRIGFVGCGGISRLYTDIYLGLHELAHVVAVADLVPELASDRAAGLTYGYQAEAAREHAIATGARSEAERDDALARAESAEDAASNTIQQFASHTELLAKAGVDAIVLLTAPSVRGGPTVEAAAQGVHVFTQGPMARSVEEADAMLDAAEASGIKLHVQVGSRYSRGMRHAQRAVASGLMGQMAMANVELNNFRPQSPYFRSSHWHGTWDGEGGTSVFHHGRYIIDPFLFVVGSPIVEVTSYAGAMLRHIETDDMTLSLVKFANGARGVVRSTLLYHTNPLTPINKIEVIGSEASMVLHQQYTQPSLPSVMLGSRENGWQANVKFGSNHDPSLVQRLDALEAEVSDAPVRATEMYQSQIWLESILGDSDTPAPLRVPHHHAELTRAVYKSQESGKTVTLPLAKDDPFYTFEGRLTHGRKLPKDDPPPSGTIPRRMTGG